MACDHLISVRVDEGTKQRFRALASRQGLSESTLLKRLLELSMSGSADSDTGAATAPDRETRDARLYVRLSPSDRRLLRERARGRDVRDATYVSLLVRAHLLEAAPLPTAELAALKQQTAALAAIGRNLNQFVRAVQGGARSPGFTAQEGIALIRVCEAMRDHTKRLIEANAASWRGGERHG